MKTQEMNIQLTNLTKHPRRSLLRLAAASAAGWVALVQPLRVDAANAGSDQAVVAPEFEGTWLETVTAKGDNLPPEAKHPFTALGTFARGGGMVGIAGNTAPTRGNTVFGTWTKTGPKQFACTFMGFYYDAKGVLENYVKVHETLRLGSDPDTYDGVSTIQLLDTKFSVIAQINGIIHGTRIHAQ